MSGEGVEVEGGTAYPHPLSHWCYVQALFAEPSLSVATTWTARDDYRRRLAPSHPSPGSALVRYRGIHSQRAIHFPETNLIYLS